ncbi:MAG: DinB family protein [Chloroflexi bacterium]|nr:DinB family protein [Chloroflexota bacterium]
MRVAFFRTYEELRELAANLATARTATANPPSTAQIILGQYHQAYRDLQAVLLGVDDEEFEKAPAKDEWALRSVLGHVLQADLFFYAHLKWGLERHRSQEERPIKMPEGEFEKYVGSWDDIEQLTDKAPIIEIMDYYEIQHQRVLDDFLDITNKEILLPSALWESTHNPIQFRLIRFDAHIRQHIIQAEKTREAISGAPSETLRLLRIIYQALSEVEGVIIGASDLEIEARKQAAAEIENRRKDITKVIAQK